MGAEAGLALSLLRNRPDRMSKPQTRLGLNDISARRWDGLTLAVQKLPTAFEEELDTLRTLDVVLVGALAVDEDTGGDVRFIVEAPTVAVAVREDPMVVEDLIVDVRAVVEPFAE